MKFCGPTDNFALCHVLGVDESPVVKRCIYVMHDELLSQTKYRELVKLSLPFDRQTTETSNKNQVI